MNDGEGLRVRFKAYDLGLKLISSLGCREPVLRKIEKL